MIFAFMFLTEGRNVGKETKQSTRLRKIKPHNRKPQELKYNVSRWVSY